MPDYRRAWHPGGTYFITVNLLQRHGNDLLTRRIEALRDSVRVVRKLYPFHIHGWVVLPDRLHCVIESLWIKFPAACGVCCHPERSEGS